MLTRPSHLGILSLLFVLPAACTNRPASTPDLVGGDLRCNSSSRDSATAATVALAAVSKVYPFRSVVAEFFRDTAGYRIVTGPAPSEAVLDGFAIVTLTRDCTLLSLIQADSA